MDNPATLALLLENLVPVLGVLACGAIPIGIVWILKSHKLRMRELDIEEKALLSRGSETRLAAREQRMGMLESAISGAALPASRAALLEGPATSGPEVARLNERTH